MSASTAIINQITWINNDSNKSNENKKKSDDVRQHDVVFFWTLSSLLQY